MIWDAVVEVEERLGLPGDVGGACFGDALLRPKKLFLVDTDEADGEDMLGTGGVVSMLRGWLFFVIALTTVAENDLDLGRAARKPGRGPAADSSRGIGDVMLREG